jgi:hypothetical protein
MNNKRKMKKKKKEGCHLYSGKRLVGMVGKRMDVEILPI